MGKWQWLLLIFYLAAAAGYGGWQGADLWRGWGVWCLLVPPLAVAAGKLVGEGRRNPGWGTLRVHLVMAVVSALALGAAALGIAWVAAEATQRVSPQPGVRAVVGAAFGAVGGGLALLYARSRRAVPPSGGNGSASIDGPAGSDAAPAPASDGGSGRS